MAVPTPPTAGEPIAEAWGDVVHDAVVAMEMQTGTAQVTMPSSATGQVTVTFPHPFASGPFVVCNIATGNRLWAIGAVNATATSFVATVSHVDNVATSTVVAFTYFAYGPRA
jgi:hypothetical protein